MGENEFLGQSDAGMGGTLTLKVSVKEGRLDSIVFLGISETIGICDETVARIPAAILDAQSIEVDNVAGATMTSAAIKEAVSKAMEAAGLS